MIDWVFLGIFLILLPFSRQKGLSRGMTLGLKLHRTHISKR